MEVVLLGHMGRDEALADRLEDHRLHVIGQWENPGLAEKAELSGGTFHTVNSIEDTHDIADYVQAIEPDMFLTNFDDALAAGVVDEIKKRVIEKRMSELLIPSPDSEAARIEWDKFFLREIIDEIDPTYNPVNFMAETRKQIHDGIDHFASLGCEVAIKPRNLTGGKGVKVQGKHLATHEEARNYALGVIDSVDQEGVEIQEKIKGHEFTLQMFTDGNVAVKPPATYDYPYREDGDKGPGTGGMGTFSMEDGLLPFINSEDYHEATNLMEKVLVELKNRELDYKGVLYPTFFKTKDGLKIVEINARGGDPELINILDLIDDDVDFGEVLRQIAKGELDADEIRYKKLGSAMLYLVSPEYGYSKGPAYDFNLYKNIIEAHDCNVRFAAAVKTGNNGYQTVGSSRTVGISAVSTTPWDAREKIDVAISQGFDHPLRLEQRKEVAEETYIRNLSSSDLVAQSSN